MKPILTITSENDFENEVCRLLEDDGFHTHHHMDEDNGVPDRSYARDGVEGWIEFKYGDKAEIRPSQAQWMAKRAVVSTKVFLLWFRPLEF